MFLVTKLCIGFCPNVVSWRTLSRCVSRRVSSKLNLYLFTVIAKDSASPVWRQKKLNYPCFISQVLWVLNVSTQLPFIISLAALLHSPLSPLRALFQQIGRKTQFQRQRGLMSSKKHTSYFQNHPGFKFSGIATLQLLLKRSSDGSVRHAGLVNHYFIISKVISSKAVSHIPVANLQT